MKNTFLSIRNFTLLFCILSIFAVTTSAQDHQAYEERLAELETKFSQSTDVHKRFVLLTDIAPAAFKAGEMDKAVAYSEELLYQAETLNKNWNTGNAIHVANLVLGSVAFKKGDVNVAKRYLLEAGRTPGSPQLNSFGPNMTLAKTFLEKGEKDVVIEYFDLCLKFWERKLTRVEDWKESIERNEMPEFGANLLYHW